jgi:hypothetical protein
LRAVTGVIVAATLALPTPSSAQDGSSARSLRVSSVSDEQIDLDGSLSEEVWDQASAATGFTQREPDDGNAATQATEFRVLYSQRALYVGVRAYDSEPSAIRARLSRRDTRSQSDEVTVFLDSYFDRRNCYEFSVTPAGSIRDGYRTESRGLDRSWDPVWEVETSIDELGWTAEFRIPLSQLRFNEDGEVWGLQVHRRIERNAEDVFWSPWSKESSGFAAHFGVLEGLVELQTPKRLEVRPYAVTSTRRRPEGTGSVYQPASTSKVDAGFDLQYGITSDFTLDLTVNPDFGQVEADPSVVNLTAFESYFREQRPFFVEGSGLFGQSGPAGQYFYSRRIGRRPSGSAGAPDQGTVERPDASTILTAAKVTGKSSAGLGVGLMSAVTTRESATLRDAAGEVVGSEPIEPWTHYFAGRVEKDFSSSNHTLGIMGTAVNRRLGTDFGSLLSGAYAWEADGLHKWRNNTYVLQWQVGVSHVRGSEEAITSVQRSPFRYFQRPDAEHVRFDGSRTSLSGHSLTVQASKRGGSWRPYFGLSRVSPGFDVNQMGFQRQADEQSLDASIGYQRSRPVGMFRSFWLGTAYSMDWTSAGERMGTWFRPLVANATLKNNWTLHLNPIAVRWGQLDVGALRGGPALRQNGWYNSFGGFATDRRKPVFVGVNGNVGGIFGTNERRWGGGPWVGIRPSDVLTFDLGLDYNWRRNPVQWVGRRTVADSVHYLVSEIDQRTLNVQARLDWTLSPEMSIQFYAQPFVSAGRYTDFKAIADPRADRYEDRYEAFGERAHCWDGTCSIDLDGDQRTDITLGDPDFNFKAIRSTAVFRWEYLPGSVVYVAWQHGRSEYRSDSSFGAFTDLADLRHMPADNTLLVKFSYWMGF